MIENYDRSVTALNTTVNNCPRDEFSFRTTSSSAVGSDQKSEATRKIICRYGRGCTHMHDACHRVKFWHPPMPALTAEQLRTHYVCNECGVATTSLEKLQLHLQRKTAWSNKSLIGCRISCLVDFKEWHEGHVTQYHRSGKHYVEFRAIGEKRWLNMKKIVFYIVERPLFTSNAFGEIKDDEIFENSGLAPIEDKWVFCDDISEDYAFAQSVLFKVYGSTVQETGHKTKGHVCLTDDDKDNAKNNKGSLLYGELLPRGANKAFGDEHLGASTASVLFDLGMGAGKVAIQAFVQYRNLKYVYGVELSHGRYCLAEEAALRMVCLLGAELFTVRTVPGQSITITERTPCTDNDEAYEEEGEIEVGVGDVTSLNGHHSTIDTHSLYEKFACETKCEELNDTSTRCRVEDFDSRCHSECVPKICGAHPQKKKRGRVLKLEFGNMFDVKNIHTADVVMLETDIPLDLQTDLCKLLSGMKESSRTLTYLDLKKIWCPNAFFPYRQLENNKNLSDRFPTSWSVQRGHHFYVWSKIFPAAQYSTNNAYLSNQIKSLCPSILGERGGTELGSASGTLPIFRSSNTFTDEEGRRKNDNSGSISTGDNSGRNNIKRGGKSQIVTGRCLPFSFSNSFRSIFSPSDGSHRVPSAHKNGIISTGSGSGPGTSNTNSPKNTAKDRDDKGTDGSANEGHRTAGLLTPGRCPSPAVRRVSEDSDKVIPLNSDGTRNFSPGSAVAPGPHSLCSGSSESWSSFSDPSSTGRVPVFRPIDPQQGTLSGTPLVAKNTMPRLRTNVEPFTNSYDNNLVDAIEVSSYLESERSKSSGRESSALDRERERERELSQDAEKSWYSRGYAIERMSFLLRGGEDMTRNTVCDGNDSESDTADSVDGAVRDDTEDYNTHGGFSLDKSATRPLPHGGTWSNSTVHKEEGGITRQTVAHANDLFPSSDPTQDGARARKGPKSFQGETIISFSGPYDSRTDGTGEQSSAVERGTCTLPLVNNRKKIIQGFDSPVPLLTARPPVLKVSDPSEPGHATSQRGVSGDASRYGKTSTQSDGSGTGCTMN